MTINVQELIELLEKAEDKQKEVVMWDDECEAFVSIKSVDICDKKRVSLNVDYGE